jgi:predicted porin
MKNHHAGHLAGAALMALSMSSGSALADQTIAEFDGGKISIFGIIDVGLLYQSKSGTSGDSKTSMETSGLRQTVLGFKGERDMGDGITAFFNLESHFDTDTGQLHGTGDARDAQGNYSVPQWRRQANVGIRGDWGSLTFGRQYGPALLAHIGTEPRAFKEQFSNLYAWAYNQLLTTWDYGSGDRNTNNDVGIFFSNAIQYRNTVGPVDFGVLYALGGQEDSMEDNSAFALGAAYNGPVVLSASYQVIKDDTTGNNNVTHWGLGAAVPVGDFTFKGNYLSATNEDEDGAEQSDVAAMGVGVDWRWNPRHTATLAYYHNKDRNNNDDQTRNVVISNDFAWKPDTTIYVQAAWVDADDGATIRTSIVAAGVPSVGNKSLLINTGINFAF